jgi:aryl-alcohol dehydrogenase-like predicted oxidoreductase
MEQRTLGTSGLSVSAIGLGCMGMSEFYGPHDDAQSLATLDAAVEEFGVTFLDTADMYGTGHNEELLGRFLKTKRGKVQLATKFGIRRPDNADNKSYVRIIDSSPAYCRTAVEASLKRLGVETIDLYYCHRINPATPVEDTVGAMADLVKQGKVRHLGLSEVSQATLRRAHAVHPIAAVQSEYSLWTRDPEDGILAACRELGVGFVAYSPLGRGFLTGAIADPKTLPEGDFRGLMPRLSGDAFAANARLVEEVKVIAAELGITAAQLALAWVLRQGKDIVPIPGTKRRTYVEQNAAALRVELTPEVSARLDTLFAPGSVTGTRYPEEGMKLVNV